MAAGALGCYKWHWVKLHFSDSFRPCISQSWVPLSAALSTMLQHCFHKTSVILLDTVNRQAWYTMRIVLDKVFAGENSDCGKQLEALMAKLQQKPCLKLRGMLVTCTGTQWALSGYLHWDRVGFEWLPPLGQSGL